jgi:hypothetical protein
MLGRYPDSARCRVLQALRGIPEPAVPLVRCRFCLSNSSIDPLSAWVPLVLYPFQPALPAAARCLACVASTCCAGQEAPIDIPAQPCCAGSAAQTRARCQRWPQVCGLATCSSTATSATSSRTRMPTPWPASNFPSRRAPALCCVCISGSQLSEGVNVHNVDTAM